MINFQYRCSCCNHVVETHEKECSVCGSRHIKSPYGFWILCFTVCLSFLIIFKIIHFYQQEPQIDKIVSDENIIKKFIKR